MTTRVSAQDLRDFNKMMGRYICTAHPEVSLEMRYQGLTTEDGAEIPQSWCAGCKGPAAQLRDYESLSRLYKTGQPVPAAIETTLARKYGSRDTMTITAVNLKQPTSAQLAKTGEVFEKQLEGFGGSMTQADRALAAMLHVGYGMQPFHFNIVHGRLYINVDGRTYAAQKVMGATFGGVQHRVLDDAARKAWKIADDEVAVEATLYKLAPNGTTFPYMTDIGIAGGRRDTGRAGNPVAVANPQQQAIARATVRVLRKGAPLGVDIGSYVPEFGEVIDVDARVEESDIAADTATALPVADPPTETRDIAVDTETGEIAELTPRPDLKPTDPVVAETVEALKQAGIDKDKLASWTWAENDRAPIIRGEGAVMGMLRLGYAPVDVAAEAFRAVGDETKGQVNLPWDDS